MQITTKFSNGDKVWHAYTNWAPVSERVCEECAGSGRLKIEGKALTIACTNGCRYGKFPVYSFVPLAQELTVGRVQVEITDSPGSDSEWGPCKSTDGTGFTNYSPITSREEKYMCIETGIGSGSVYPVEDLFATEADALEHAKIKAVEAAQWRKEDDERRERARQSEIARLKLEEAEYV